MTTLQEYRALADISSRSSCPRCQGFGFVHASSDKHDKVPTLRCKKCIDCSVCDASGVTFGVVECGKCQGMALLTRSLHLIEAKGFIHPPSDRPHTLSPFQKCFDCIVCADCKGACCLNQQRIEELKLIAAQKARASVGGRKQFSLLQVHDKRDTFAMEDMLTLPPMVPDTCALASGVRLAPYNPDPTSLHPHLASILGLPLTPDLIQILTSTAPNASIARKLERQNNKMPIECPRCIGLGTTHPGSKHAKSEKCKKCTVCKGCAGFGRVVGKVACGDCSMRGFVHESTEREHDVAEYLRCFFCRDCARCGGLGLEEIKKRKKDAKRESHMSAAPYVQ